MKTLCYEDESGKARTAKVSRKTISILMGDGKKLENPSLEIERLAVDIGLTRAIEWISALSSGGLTEDEALLAIGKKDCPDGTIAIHIIDVAPDHKKGPYYDARIWRDGQLDFDIVKARDIHRNRLREARAPKLTALDVEYQRADELDDIIKKNEVIAKKQVLRNLTADSRIEEAQTTDELEAIWPKELA